MNYQKGMKALLDDNYLYAIDHFQKSIIANENRKEALIGKGLALYRCGKNQSAIEEFEKVMDELPDSPQGFLQTALVYSTLGQYQKSLKLHEKSIFLDDKDWRSYSGKGYTLNKMGRHQKSLFCFENAMTKNKNNDPASYLGRAEALFETRNTEAGKKDIIYAKKAIKDPENTHEYSKIQKQIIQEGIANYERLMQYFSQRSEKGEIFEQKKIEKLALEQLKLINKSFHVHNLNILRNGSVKIASQLKDKQANSDAVIKYESQSTQSFCSCQNCSLF